MTQMALNFCDFSGTFLNMLRIFFVRQNNFWKSFSFYNGIFLNKSPEI